MIQDPLFPAGGPAAEGKTAVPVFQGFHCGSRGMRSIQLREGDNPK
ncbi:MAG TPA: hypothetical protein VFI16_12580 [Anaeromyxobacteraceae bacterium]|nr:hypothetical protein [Anaeromyxobacteraceae bacterium]